MLSIVVDTRLLPDGTSILLGPLDQRAELKRQPVARHLHQIQGRLSRRGFKIGSGPSAKLENLHFIVHHYAGGHVPAEQDTFSLPVHVKVVRRFTSLDSPLFGSFR